MQRIKNKELYESRLLLIRFGYEQMLLTMDELAVIFKTTKQNVSKILSVKKANNTR
jgi:hypothetical protein